MHLPGTANSLADAHSQYGYKQRPRIHSPEVPPTFLPDLICFYLLCICQAQLTAWPMLCPTITPLPPFSVPITHRPTPIPAPVIDLLAHSKTQLDCSTLYYLVCTHKKSTSPLSAPATASSHTLARKEPSAYSWHTSGSSTHLSSGIQFLNILQANS